MNRISEINPVFHPIPPIPCTGVAHTVVRNRVRGLKGSRYFSPEACGTCGFATHTVFCKNRMRNPRCSNCQRGRIGF